MEHYQNLNLKKIKGEAWKNVPGYELNYMVSNLGRIKSLSRIVERGSNSYRKKETILAQTITQKGYLIVELSALGHTRIFYIHKLVAKLFIKNTKGYKVVVHGNENKTDNRVINLGWSSSSMKGRKGAKNHLAKKILQYDLSGKIVKEWPSLSEIKTKLKFSIQNITLCCKGEQKTSNGFIWKYKKGRLVKKINVI